MLPRFVPEPTLVVETSGKTALDELNVLQLLQQQGYDLQQYRLIDYRPTDDNTYQWIIERIDSE